MLISVVHQMCTYALYVGTTLFKRPSFAFEWYWAQGRETDHDETEQRNQELDHEMHMLCTHFHSLPSARVITVWSAFRVSNPPWRHQLHSKGQARCVDCADTVCVQEYPVHSHVDGLWVLPADIRSLGLKSPPAPFVFAQATHQNWTNGYCAHHRLRAYTRWLHTCTCKVMRIKSR